jgi:hypothetical protein
MAMVLIASVLLSLPAYRQFVPGLTMSGNDLRLFAGAAFLVAVGLFLLGRPSAD